MASLVYNISLAMVKSCQEKTGFYGNKLVANVQAEDLAAQFIAINTTIALFMGGNTKTLFICIIGMILESFC